MLRGPAVCPTRQSAPAHMSRSRSGRLGGMQTTSHSSEGDVDVLVGSRACERRRARGVADLRQLRSRARAAGSWAGTP
eukprot:6815758-Prymnesium_polylepis.1